MNGLGDWPFACVEHHLALHPRIPKYSAPIKQVLRDHDAMACRYVFARRFMSALLPCNDPTEPEYDRKALRWNDKGKDIRPLGGQGHDNPTKDLVYRYLSQFHGFSPTVLAIGCGTGKELLDAARTHHLATLIGVDISKNMLNVMRRHLRKELGERQPWAAVQSHAEQLPLETGSMDLVLLRNLLNRVPQVQDHSILSEARRVVSPGGLLMIQGPGPTHYSKMEVNGEVSKLVPPDASLNHPEGRALCKEYLRSLCEKTGWKVISQRYVHWDELALTPSAAIKYTVAKSGELAQLPSTIWAILDNMRVNVKLKAEYVVVTATPE